MTTDADVSIRTGSRQINTPSLLEPGNEPVPGEIFRDLLKQEWIETEVCPRPTIVIVNDREHSGQHQLKDSDVIFIDANQLSEEQRGHRYEHKDMEVPLTFEFKTVVSRQRLWNLMAEVRRIVYKWMMSARPYQQLYWDGFNDTSDGAKNVWTGVATGRATSRGVPVFSGVTTGQESPNVAPEEATGHGVEEWE